MGGLVARGDIRISEHGYDELAADGLFVEDLIQGMPNATLVEDYPEYPKGPCVLTLLYDSKGRPVHVVWGIPSDHERPGVLVTAYRPDPERWKDGFMRRRV